MAETETSQATAVPALEQEVEIIDKGPCLKHIKVTIPRTIIDEMVQAKLGDLQQTAAIPGFRPGRAPERLVRRYLEPQVLEEIRPTLLMASLEDLLKKHNLNPISMPDFDPLQVEIPKEGPLTYELDMEVWPEFTLPPYKGLKLRRPVFPITDELVDKFIEYRFRHLASRVERREQAEPGDLVIGTLEIRRNGEKVAEIPDVRLVCQSELHFRDGVVKNFLEVITGARPGEVRHFTIELSPREGSEGVPATAEASLRVEDVCHVYPAESLDDVLQALGLQSMDQLRELARQMLAQRIEALQAHFLHQQVMKQWVQQVRVDLPPRLLQQLHIRTLRRRVEELLQMGYSPDEINRHSQILIRDALSVAAGDIVAQMLVQKIADQENIEITEEDLQKGIERLAEELGETPRRLRARLEREGRLEDLAMALLSQRVMQLIYQQADIEDVPAGEIAPEDLFDPDRLPSLHRRLEEQLFGQPAATPQIIVPPGTETSTSAEAPATSGTGSSSSSGEAATSAETPPAEDRPNP